MTFKHSFLLISLLFCLSCQTPTSMLEQPQTKDQAIIEAISFGGKELPQRTASVEKQIKYQDLIATLQAKKRLTEEEYLELGGYYIELYQFNNAIAAFTKGLVEFPNSFKLLRHRGHRYMSIRKLEKAYEDLTKAENLMKPEFSKVAEYYADGKIKGTYEFWIYYHLGLYHYLNNNFPKAIQAYQKCLATATTSKNVVGATDWLYNSYQKNGEIEKAATLLTTISTDYDTDQNYVYFKRLMLYKGLIKPETLLPSDKSPADWNGLEMTYAYAVGNWYKMKGEYAKAMKIREDILALPYWNSWAYLVTDKEIADYAAKRK